MAGSVAFVSSITPNDPWLAALTEHLPERRVVAIDDSAGTAERAEVEFAVAATPPPGVLATLPNLRFVQSLWAGVDALLADPTLPDVPLARLVDPVMTSAMTVTVVGHVTSLHLDLHGYRRDQAGRRWDPRPQRPTRDVAVVVLGLGELGVACGRALTSLGFDVVGWSRRARRVDGVDLVTGPVEAVLSRADIVVNLLPLTPDTHHLLDRARLACLRPGAGLVNVGRGATVDTAALIELLDAGHVGHAVLDVFETEPLPADDPLWGHPRVTITPHVAAETSIDSACGIAADNIERFARTGTADHLVDRARGY